MTKAAGKKTSSKKRARDLSAIPAAELAAKLRRRERRMQALVRRYARIMDAAAKLRREIEALGGSTGTGSSVGAPNVRPTELAQNREILDTKAGRPVWFRRYRLKKRPMESSSPSTWNP